MKEADMTGLGDDPRAAADDALAQAEAVVAFLFAAADDDSSFAQGLRQIEEQLAAARAALAGGTFT
jgi:hypothetical protein